MKREPGRECGGKGRIGAEAVLPPGTGQQAFVFIFDNIHRGAFISPSGEPCISCRGGSGTQQARNLPARVSGARKPQVWKLGPACSSLCALVEWKHTPQVHSPHAVWWSEVCTVAKVAGCRSQHLTPAAGSVVTRLLKVLRATVGQTPHCSCPHAHTC